MSTNISQLPQDKTPAQRAQIKLWEQFGAVFLFNAALAALVLYSSYASQQSPNWLILIVAASAQGVLALFNVLEKYFSANNQPLYSALFEAARQEVQVKAPQVQYSASDQALQQSINAALYPASPVPAQSVAPMASTPVVASQSTSIPSSLKPVTLQPMLAENTPVVPPTPNLPPPGTMTTNTVPGIPIPQPQAQ